MGFECLKDYIGIKWQNGEIPESGLYINQLPGVSLKSIDYLANAENKTFLGVWDDVQVRSLKRLQTAVTNYFAKRYQLATINEAMQLPEYYQDGSQNTAAGANYRGFTFDLGWYGSPLASIHIHNLRLFLKAPQNELEIKIFEVVDNNMANLLETITIDAVAGWNTIKVQTSYPVYKVFVGYDATAQDSVYMPLNNGAFTGETWFGWYGYAWGPPVSMYEGKLRGAQSDKPYDELSENNNTYGLSGSLSVVCGYQNIVCKTKEVFTTTLWYLEGVELMNERIYTERLNRFTTIDHKLAYELRSEFERQYNAEIAACLDGIELTTWDACIRCSAPVRLEHALP